MIGQACRCHIIYTSCKDTSCLCVALLALATDMKDTLTWYSFRRILLSGLRSHPLLLLDTCGRERRGSASDHRRVTHSQRSPSALFLDSLPHSPYWSQQKDWRNSRQRSSAYPCMSETFDRRYAAWEGFQSKLSMAEANKQWSNYIDSNVAELQRRGLLRYLRTVVPTANSVQVNHLAVVLYANGHAASCQSKRRHLQAWSTSNLIIFTINIFYCIGQSTCASLWDMASRMQRHSAKSTEASKTRIHHKSPVSLSDWGSGCEPCVVPLVLPVPILRRAAIVFLWFVIIRWWEDAHLDWENRDERARA